MPRPRILRPAAALALLLTTSACALLPGHARLARVTPVTSATSKIDPADGYYAAASAAIDRRDYGEALDLLQAARARKADDVRVLNAFGVVYDKLGRFDLSARYYAQAKALDANSAVVDNNIAYSRVLQRQVAVQPLMTAGAGERPAPAPVLYLAAASSGVFYLNAPPPAPLVLGRTGITGHPLVVINASGRKDGAEPVRLALARQGWTAPKSLVADAPRQARTTIRYPEINGFAARALARTLPAPARMVACSHPCVGVRLVVGADSGQWTFRSRLTSKAAAARAG